MTTKEMAENYLASRIQNLERVIADSDNSLDGIVDEETIQKIKKSYKRERRLLIYLEGLVINDK